MTTNETPRSGESPKRQPSWRTIADGLAARLYHHAYYERHDDPNEDQDCPFCDDIRALAAYRAKGGTLVIDSWNRVLDTAERVAIEDVKPNWPDA